MNSNFILIIFCSFFLAIVGKAQTTGFSDDFSDGNFSAKPKWIGDTTKFEVQALSLRLNDTSSQSPAYLSTHSYAINNAEWQFKLNLQFAPSSSNYARVFIVSDQADPQNASEGYFVQIGGESGNLDAISLYRFDGSAEEKIIDGRDGIAADQPHLKIKVLRDSAGFWELFTDSSALFNNWQLEGSAIDTSYRSSTYFSIQCLYTSTRSDLFYFDDFMVIGKKALDTLPPELLQVIVLSDSSIQLKFSENISPITALKTTNFSLNGGLGLPSSVAYASDSSQLLLNFKQKFIPLKSYELWFDSLMDNNANYLKAQIVEFIYYLPQKASKRDLLINEIFADPYPPVGMPDAEFIEIYNASNKAFDLQNWILQINSTEVLLGPHLLLPDSFLILSNSMAYENYGAYQQSNFSSLNNSGATISLLSPDRKLIDQINYRDSWYADNNKMDGGYSLEQINPFLLCASKSNFKASKSEKGASPGKENSIFNPSPDISPPYLEKAYMLSNDSIKLFFNEALDSSSIKASKFSFSSNSNVTFLLLNSIKDEITLGISPPMDTGKIQSLLISGLLDCSGNRKDEMQLQLILPESADKNDVIINEILFNPRSGGYDFVEFYNRSDKVISLKNWSVANEETAFAENRNTISTEPYLLYPFSYKAVSVKPENIIQEYPKSIVHNLIKVPSLPAFGNEEGKVYLYDAKGKIIDHMSYTENMHFELLNNFEGVSLEKINPHLAGTIATNFTSAASTEGFASPAYQNSQFFVGKKFEGSLNVEPEIFSPDNDGYNDVLHINYQFASTDNVATVNIFDKNGQLIKNLCNNQLLGSAGSLQWDGISEDGEKAKIGIYVIHFASFNLDGEKQEIKETCVLAAFLDK